MQFGRFFILIMLSGSFFLNATELAATHISLMPADTIAPTTKGIPAFSFDQEFIELGKVKKGESRNFEIQLTNTGDTNLTIDYISSCDCTTLDYPTRAIKPQETVLIKVLFNSTEKEESENVDIDVFFKNLDSETGLELYKNIQYHFDLEL